MSQENVLKVLEEMKGKPLNNKEISKRIGINATSTSKNLFSLLKRNEVKKINKFEKYHNVSYYFI